MMTADGDVPAELSKLQQAYELLGELSRDELVTVYVARDRRSGQEVAIKVLRAANAQGREALAHYASDARMLTALEHPNIIAVHGVKWLSEDVVAVITERVRGPTLRQVLDVAGTLPVARATEVLRGLARALAWAHSSQVMHRDLRPENVIFEDRSGRVVLSDFGLARRIDVVPKASEMPDAYRAPELADGRYPDRRSDVFSLGIVGWELLTGRRPWPDDMEPIATVERAPQPPPLAEVRPGLPPALVAAIEAAVQLDRDRRLADVVTFLERLTAVGPPPRQADEEEAEEQAPLEWVALPMPRMPQRPSGSVPDREIPRERVAEPARSANRSNAVAAEPEEPAPAADQPTTDISTEAISTSGAPTTAASTLNVARRDVVVPIASAEDVALPDLAEANAAQAAASATSRSTPDVASTPPSPPPVQVMAPDVGVPETPRVADRLEATRLPRERRPGFTAPAEPISAGTRSADATPPAGRLSSAERKRQAKGGIAQPTAAPGLTTPTERANAGTMGRESALERRPTHGDEQTRDETSQRDKPQRGEPQRGEPRGDAPRARPSATGAAGLAAGAAPAAASGAEHSGATRDAPRVDTQRTPAPHGEVARAKRGRADMPPAKAPLADAPESEALESNAPNRAAPRADAPLGDATGTTAPPRAPFEPDERIAARWNKPLSDVELPPPEPVPFADTRADPLTGPISGPIHNDPRPVERFEPAMRGGLATPRPPKPSASGTRERKSRGKKRDSGAMAVAPLQPVWDTPAEFPLPVMPDPRPMPADAGRGAPSDARRRWTRRGIGIAAIVTVALIAAILLARMERAPDTTADLMRPESPIGYGGDVSLEPRAADTATVQGPDSARAGEAAAARRSGGPASTSPRTRNSAPPTTRANPSNPPETKSGAAAPTRGATPSAAPREGAPTTSSRTSAPTRSAPAAARRADNTTATPSRTTTRAATPAAAVAASDANVERPTGACRSPALADQRACLAAQIASSDAGLNEIYGDLVVAMRQRANTAPGDPDPPEVQRLRAVQRSWLARRDAECRRRGRGREGPLWATPRGRCLAEFSAARTRELSATLARLRRD